MVLLLPLCYRSPEVENTTQENKSPPPQQQQQQERMNNSHLRIRGLTRNVTAAHVEEIMGTFGKIQEMHFAIDEALNLPSGYADVTYTCEEDGTKAKEYMHGGQIDGVRVTVLYRRNVGRDKRDKKKRAKSPPQRRGRSPSPLGWKGRRTTATRSRSPYRRPRELRSRSPYARRGRSR